MSIPVQSNATIPNPSTHAPIPHSKNHSTVILHNPSKIDHQDPLYLRRKISLYLNLDPITSKSQQTKAILKTSGLRERI